MPTYGLYLSTLVHEFIGIYVRKLSKVNAYDGVFNNSDIALDDHFHCRFGKWKEAKGKELFAHTKNYEMADKPHAIVHNSAIKALECVKSGTCLNDINVVINYFDEVEKASKELFLILDNMIEEV